MEKQIVIYITSANAKEAGDLANGLVKEGLVACVNIVPSIRSIYKWKGNICDETEILLIVKSHESVLEKIIEWVKKHHSYETPEIIALPVLGGSKEYLQWVDDCCRIKPNIE